MRLLAALAVALAAAVAAGSVAPAGAAGARDDRGAAALVFISIVHGEGGGEGESRMRAFFDAAAPGFSIGLLSPTLGRGAPPAQVFLDVGQGARVDYSLYPPMPAHPESMANDRMVAAAELRRRAARPPADIVPGLLSDALARAGVATRYVSGLGPVQPGGLTAMRSSGAVDFSPAAPARASARAGLGLAREGLTIVFLRRDGRDAAAGAFPETIAAITRSIAPGGTVILVGHDDSTARPWPLAVRGPGFGGGTLASASVRSPGIVPATDIAPTLLAALGAAPPGEMSANRLASRPGGSPAESTDLADRLAVIEQRRLVAVGALAAAAAILLFAAWASRRRAPAALAVRSVGLGPAWLPAVFLFAAWLGLGFAWEIAAIVLVCAAVCAVTAACLPGPYALLFAACVSTAAVLFDVATGSEVTRISLIGPNPLFGARFFGIGNELAGLLAASILLALGIAADLAKARRPAIVLACGGLVASLGLGLAELGADVGGAATMGAGSFLAAAAATAFWKRHGGRPVRWATGIVALAGGAIVAVAATYGVDRLIGAGGHLGAAVASRGGTGGPADTIYRRFDLLGRELLRPEAAGFVGLALLLLAAGWIWRGRVLRSVEGMPATRAAFGGGAAMAIVGLVTNDAGSLVVIGVTAVLLFTIVSLEASSWRSARESRLAGGTWLVERS